ncbi:MAG: phosphatidic acid phosphatase [Oscillospiraceae bacterium]|nr:phosphatidic acid phosphatase [Oscillospiraceae bacterium]
MKKPVVDYREFRFSRLNTPQFAHMKPAILGWLFYFSFYFLTENLIPAEICHPIHCALDDMIPFCEYFAVFYVFWYLLVFGSLIFTLLYDVESFTRLSKFIFITQFIAMTIYILYPSRQDLRPEVFLRDNFLTRLMAFIYSFDTSTGVFPSLHVAYSMGILSVALKKKDLGAGWKWSLAVLVVLICLATAFVKQHSMLDVFAALPVSLAAELLVYWNDYWKPRLTGKKE